MNTTPGNWLFNSAAWLLSKMDPLQQTAPCSQPWPIQKVKP